jgi:acyl-CoA synthetase (AMP-forming)/AMP-acid ligase II
MPAQYNRAPVSAVPLDPLVLAFERSAARRPEAALLASPERRMTAGTLAALTGALHARLAGAFPAGSLVGLAAPGGPAFLAGLLALLRSDLRPVLHDPGTPAVERDRALGSLGAAGSLVTTRAWPEGTDAFVTAPLHGDRRLPGPALVKLTSGSTGEARGVVTPIEALLADVEALHAGMGFGDGERYLATIPLSHSYGLATLAVPVLTRGATLVLPGGQGPFEGLRAARALQATVLPTVPGWLEALLRVSAPPPLPPTVRTVLTAGAPLPPETARRFREVHGLAVHVFYGASECGGICYDAEGQAGERGTVGRPLPGVDVRLVDGVVEVRSPAVAAGYLPEPDPRLAGGVFRTGDLAQWSGEELRLTGRADDLINLRGKKVHPGEIERVLRQLPGVEEVVALAVPSPDRPDPMLRVVVACREGRLRGEDVVAWCRTQLADHKVPRSVILLETLPRNERGKVDRAALRSL